MKNKIFALIICLPAALSVAHASGIFADHYTMDKSFTDASSSVTMGLAFDGANYWSASGGSSGGLREAEYDSSGNVLGTFAPGLDFRSIFTGTSGGTVFARNFADGTVYAQTSPGTFSAYTSLAGGITDSQAAVVMGQGNTEFDSESGGTISRWDLSGNSLSSISLSGFGSASGTENTYPNNRNLASFGQYYVTFDNGMIYGWDAAGNRVGAASLDGSGTSFDSNFGFSYAADGRFWVADAGLGTWRGYQVAAAPEPATFAALGLGLLVALRRRKKA